jgi:hypothetical protein
VAGKVTAIPRLSIYWRISGRIAGKWIKLINHLQKWSISLWRMFLWVPQGKRDSLTEWETPSQEKLGQSGRSCEPMSIGQSMIPVRLLLWARRSIQRSPVETEAKLNQNRSVWSSMARWPRAGPQECVGRSDTHKGQTFEEPHTYVMKHQSNATSKSQASKK